MTDDPATAAADPERPDDETQADVWALAELARSKGLRFWDVEFEVISRRRMVEIGTYVLPYRWSHWTFGREYARMQRLHDLGLVEILELVINTRPARAYLIDANGRDDNRMVIAHVYAHVDFFANNMWFERTPDNILREAHHHERRIRALQEEYGHEAVERVLDQALAIQWHVDFYRHYERAEPRIADRPEPIEGMTPSDLERLPRRKGPTPHPPPARSPGAHRDILEFLLTHAPLDDLERELLSMVRDETLYFYPNALTKIMNEGWATYWHADLLREYLPFSSFDAFAVKHSHLMQSEGINPYKLGFLIYEDIRRRGDAELGPGKGLERIFEVRRYGDDVSFIRDHLTQEVVDQAGLYLFDQDPETGERKITSTRVEDIKPQVLAQLENLGKPYITVRDGDHAGQGELLLQHHFDGREIDMDYAGDVLQIIHRFWKRPVHLDSQVGGKPVRLDYDGERARMVDLSGGSQEAASEAVDEDEAPEETGVMALPEASEQDGRAGDAASGPAENGSEEAPGGGHETSPATESGDGRSTALVPGQTRLPSGARARRHQDDREGDDPPPSDA